jgi:hypothetical protein
MIVTSAVDDAGSGECGVDHDMAMAMPTRPAMTNNMTENNWDFREIQKKIGKGVRVLIKNP